MEVERDNLNKMAVLDPIIGARLTSVQFVLDYLILGFDEKGALTSLVWPEIISRAGSTVKFGMQGYRDNLCDPIAQVVSAVHVSEDETITISFGDNALRIRYGKGKLRASGQFSRLLTTFFTSGRDCSMQSETPEPTPNHFRQPNPLQIGFSMGDEKPVGHGFILPCSLIPKSRSS
jgi:hypothetical protein